MLRRAEIGGVGRGAGTIVDVIVVRNLVFSVECLVRILPIDCNLWFDLRHVVGLVVWTRVVPKV